MTWLKIDDQSSDHPKWIALMDRCPEQWATAKAIWLDAGCYASRQLTDGLITMGALRRIIPLDSATINAAANALVDVGLWIATPDGFLFHDWLDYQPSRAEVIAKRERERERKREARAKRKGGNASARTTGGRARGQIAASVHPDAHGESRLSAETASEAEKQSAGQQMPSQGPFSPLKRSDANASARTNRGVRADKSRRPRTPTRPDPSPPEKELSPRSTLRELPDESDHEAPSDTRLAKPHGTCPECGRQRRGNRHECNPPPQQAIELALLLRREIEKRDPANRQIRPGKWPRTRIEWAHQLRQLHERDERPWEQIEAVLRWSQADDFWQAQILSARNLRAKFDQLVAQMQRTGRGRSAAPAGRPRGYTPRELLERAARLEAEEKKRGER